MPGVLEGIRVIDLSRILAAPLSTQMLGDLGADVVKVERPLVGDDSRQYGPPFLGVPEDQMAAFYLSCNRNKRSITLDFTTERGNEILLELIASADVVVENFRPGVLDKYGLGWATLHERYPSLVLCSVTGFGQDGPLRNEPGYDGIFQAMSGMMAVSGHPDGAPGAGPMKSGLSLIDILTGLYASSAILGALRHRDRTGVGQHLDVSLLDCGIAALSHYAQNYQVTGQVPERRGNGGFGGIPSQAFECADGKMFFIVATTNPQFGRACAAIGHPELASDPRFDSIAHRIEHRLDLLPILEKIFLGNTAEHWVTLLKEADVPAAPVNDVAQALDSEHARARGLEISMEDAQGRTVSGLGYPIRMSESPVAEYVAPPTLGADTESVLSELLGMDSAEVGRLKAEGVL